MNQHTRLLRDARALEQALLSIRGVSIGSGFDGARAAKVVVALRDICLVASEAAPPRRRRAGADGEVPAGYRREAMNGRQPSAQP